MNDKLEKYKVSLSSKKRNSNNEFVNLYLDIHGFSFELVPHCRSKREMAVFYSLLRKSELMPND